MKYTNGIIGHLSSVGNIANHDGEIIAVRGLDHSSVVIVTDASFHKFAQQILQDFDPHLILRDECHWGYSDEGIQTLNLFEEAVIVGYTEKMHNANEAKKDNLGRTERSSCKEGLVPTGTLGALICQVPSSN